MPRYLVTEKVYVDAKDEWEARGTVSKRLAGYERDRVAVERVAPKLEVGRPVRLASRDKVPRALVPLGSEGVVLEVGARGDGSVTVLFHAQFVDEHSADGPPWTRQYVAPGDLEIVERWPQ